MQCPVGWSKLTTNISNNRKKNWNRQQYVGKAFRSRAIVGHWYTIVSIDFHEHAMTDMMVLRQVYALVVDLPMRGSLSKGWITRDRGYWGTWKVSNCTEGVTRLCEGLCSREGNSRDGFFLVISITRWNQMHIGSVPWNNELVTIR